MITSFFKPKAKAKPKAASPGYDSSHSTSNFSTDGSSATTNKRSLDEDGGSDDDPRESRTGSRISRTNDGVETTSIKRTKVEDGRNNTSIMDNKGRLSKAVSDLIEHLDSHGGGNDPRTWKSALGRQFASPRFTSLAELVAAERRAYRVYPSPSNTWTALNVCPLESVKVVIVGQDPYHGPNQAHGLAFSVERGQAIPPSLRNIYKELKDDPAVPEFHGMPTHGNLLRWAQQGVLMLNTVMTVRSGQPNSHAKRGWEAVTDEILRHASIQKTPVVFLLWGKPAEAKAQSVRTALTRHTIICTSHPSPLGATKTSRPFLGSRCFSRCNAALVQMGMEPIDWRVDGPL